MVPPNLCAVDSSVKQVIHLLVNAAGRNANLLLNIGPLANGVIQPEFRDTLAAVGDWLKKYGESVYGTRGNLIAPQPWGVLTTKNNSMYLHILKPPAQSFIFIPGINKKIKKALVLNSNKQITVKRQAEGMFIYLDKIDFDPIDTIIQL